MPGKHLYAVAAVFLTLLMFCDKDLTAPDHAKPGSRNYVWEVDTLDMPMNYLSSIWGASPNDVWAVGGGGTYNDRLQHYDGTTWSAYNKEPINVGGFALFGFGADDVWIGGQAGWGWHGAALWHYNGVEWSQNFVYSVEGAKTAEVQDLWGIGSTDLYASGVISFYDGSNEIFRGFLLHYDGKQWREVIRGPLDSQFLYVRGEGNNLYVLSYTTGLRNNTGEVITFFKIEATKLEEIYTIARTDIYWASFNLIREKVFFVIGKEISSYLHGAFVKQFSCDDPEFNSVICGRSKDDIFLSTKKGIAHYNGKDTEYIYTFPSSSMSNTGYPMIFEKEIFWCVTNLSGTVDDRNLILHGTIVKGGEQTAK